MLLNELSAERGRMVFKMPALIGSETFWFEIGGMDPCPLGKDSCIVLCLLERSHLGIKHIAQLYEINVYVSWCVIMELHVLKITAEVYEKSL